MPADVHRRVPLHTLLVGAYAVLFLWSSNVDEVAAGDALAVLWRVLLGVVVVAAVGAALLRHLLRGAFVATVLVALALTHGHVWADDSVLGLVVWGALALAGTGAALWLPERGIREVTLGANVVALVLVVLNLPPVIGAVARSLSSTDAAPGVVTAAGVPARDIVYIVPDRYGSERSLREVFGFDNSPFIDWLESRGFQVADDALANYNKTAHSMASTLNLDYLDDLAASVPDARGGDWGPVYALLRRHEVGRILTDAGYRYIHMGTWWSPTANADDADVVLNHDRRSEFARVFEDTTVLPALERLVGTREVGSRQRIRNHTLYQFAQLERLAAQRTEQPRFILAHITLPHEPYVFEADGSWVPQELERQRTRGENLTRQVEYANVRLQAIIERFLDRPPDEQPIIVLQADEGPHPVGYLREAADYHWPSAPVEEVREKLRILSATYLPGAGAPTIPEDTTPVNTFRTILDWHLGTDLGRLPDRAFVFRDEHHLYDLIDVTDRIR